MNIPVVDIEATVGEYLPAITHYFPGSGISVFTVWDTPYHWWVRYVTECRKMLKETAGGE